MADPSTGDCAMAAREVTSRRLGYGNFVVGLRKYHKIMTKVQRVGLISLRLHESVTVTEHVTSAPLSVSSFSHKQTSPHAMNNADYITPNT